ncbi:MAG: type II secretion system protein [Pseudomonadota bacterium]
MKRTTSDAGFTLIEVLVSLAIFSLAIVGLNRAATLAVSGTAELTVRTHAGIVADNAVVLRRLEPVEVGTDRFEDQSGGIEFDIVVETVRTEQAGFYELLIRVSQSEQTRILSERRAFLYEGSGSSGATP